MHPTRTPRAAGALAGRAALLGWLAAGALAGSVGSAGVALDYLRAPGGVSARCTVTWTDPGRAADVGRVLAADPDATVCFQLGPAQGAQSGIRAGPPMRIMLHTTGYSFQDNQGGNNARISCGVIHRTAGGVGTYDDPTTVAVPGHAGQGTETPCGTRFYVPKYQRYFIVEDTGATKYADAPHIDIYVDGQDGSPDASYRCQEAVTTDDGRPTPAIVNPPPGEPVRPGPIAQGGTCHL